MSESQDRLTRNLPGGSMSKMSKIVKYSTNIRSLLCDDMIVSE